MADTSSAAGNADAPVAEVNNGLGPTEIAHYIVMLGSLLASTGLHSDLGLTSHAADLAPLVLLVATVSLGLMRGWKHHSAMKFNAMTYLGQLQHVANVVAASGGSPTSLKALTAGVSALNGAIQQDFPAGDASVAVPSSPAVNIPVDTTPVPAPAVDTTPVPVDSTPAPVDVPVPATVIDAQPGAAPAVPVDTNPLPANLDMAPHVQALVDAGWTPPVVANSGGKAG